MLVLVGAVASMLSPLTGFAGESCFEDCDRSMSVIGERTIAIGPWVVVIGAALATSLRLRAGRRGWPMSVIGIGLVVLLVWMGLVVAFAR